MHLVQILLPLTDNLGRAFDAALYRNVRHELTERFGGLTAYSRSPASGLWKEDEQETVRDDVVVYEVMADDLDRRWWQTYREKLRMTFRQDTLIVRALEIELL
ncbi:hypothetical protein [Deinococcus yavapaiensis]|uniref:Uncharacterized protein n=1 Tax=Deinococcus yavapaiensis KR-236 TaxID=694435 RepID=A0A318S8I4_9DEIO|nr:hypothetical protein [Deinococcus yavapaiensis]PYE54156.1 hypothetical protein DES52_106121 [Deinococcus yavapaiensis KR-236]